MGPPPDQGLAALGFYDTDIHNFTAAISRSGDDGSGSEPDIPITRHTSMEGCVTIATTPPLHMWSGGRCGPDSNLLGDGHSERASQRGGNPKPFTCEGSTLL